MEMKKKQNWYIPTGELANDYLCIRCTIFPDFLAQRLMVNTKELNSNYFFAMGRHIHIWLKVSYASSLN